MSSVRKIKYSNALNEAITQLMRYDKSVMLIGQGVKSPWYVGNTCKGLIEEFGEERVIDTPVSENAITGAAVGAALAGMKSIVVHPRADFVLYAFDPIINQSANWHYMSGGNAHAPVVFWLIINRGGEQAAQHSQALHSIFAHIPGLKVVAPSNAYDVKGIFISAVNDPDPVIFIDDRWLYGRESDVPEEMFEVPIGKAFVKKQGKDVTLISSSYTASICEALAEEMMNEGTDVEFIDLCTLKPFDKKTILESVNKTGRAVVVDGSWKTFGYAAEISATIAENVFNKLKAPVSRVCLPDAPAPASRSLEENYYINKDQIREAIHAVINYSK